MSARIACIDVSDKSAGGNRPTGRPLPTSDEDLVHAINEAMSESGVPFATTDEVA